MKYAKVKVKEYGGYSTRVMVLLETANDVYEAITRYGTNDDEEYKERMINELPLAIPILRGDKIYTLYNYSKKIEEVLQTYPIGPAFIEIGERDGPGATIAVKSWRMNNLTWVEKGEIY